VTRWIGVPLRRSLGDYAAAWDALNERAFQCHPLLTSLFVEGLLRDFGDGSERLYVLPGQDRPEAMCILRPINTFIWASFLPSQAQIAPTLIPDGAVLRSLIASMPPWVYQLDLLCNDPAVGGVLADEQPPTKRLHHALTMNVLLDGGFDAYWAARAKHLQSNIRRYRRRLQEEGLASRVVRYDAPHQVLAALDRYAELEGASWKAVAGTALTSTPAQYQFYARLMLEAAGAGNAAIYELWLGETLAASRIVLRQGTVAVMLKTSYAKRYAAFAPGRLLLHDVIACICAAGGQRIEFYTDADPSLLEWASSQRWIQHETLYRHGVAETLLATLTALRVVRRRHLRIVKDDGRGVVEVYRSLDAMPQDGRDFLQRAERDNIEFGLAWHRNLVATVYPNDTGVHFYLLRMAGRVVALLPLRAEPVTGGWHLRGLGNFYTTLYQPVLENSVRSVDLVPLLSAIRRDFPGLASLTLTPMDPASHAYQALLGAIRVRGWLPYEFFCFGNWYQPVQGDWQGYLKDRHGTLRSTIKRMLKKFSTDGGVLEIVSEPQALAGAIAAYESVYAASWKKPEPFPEFMPGLLASCARSGVLRLGLAWLNGKPIAAQAWIVSHGRAAIYKVAYHEAYKQYAPGTLVTALLMEHVIDVDQVREVDYLIGDDPYKKTWMACRRERWGIVAYNPRSLRGLAGLAREVLGRSVRGLARRWRARRAGAG
jgi:CelD/BcsL family acetyltransferase involved in cellulose biosynthesis